MPSFVVVLRIFVMILLLYEILCLIICAAKGKGRFLSVHLILQLVSEFDLSSHQFRDVFLSVAQSDQRRLSS